MCRLPLKDRKHFARQYQTLSYDSPQHSLKIIFDVPMIKKRISLQDGCGIVEVSRYTKFCASKSNISSWRRSTSVKCSASVMINQIRLYNSTSFSKHEGSFFDERMIVSFFGEDLDSYNHGRTFPTQTLNFVH